MMKFTVTSPDGESFNLTLKSNLTGSTLLTEAYTSQSIPQDVRKYFGLSFIHNQDGGKEWIRPDQQLKKLKFTQCNGVNQVEFSVSVYPRDPHLELPTAANRRLYRQHLKHLLGNDVLKTDAGTAVTLDALLAQAELGDVDKVEGKYAQKLGELEIYAPIALLCGTSFSEKEYQLLVKEKHATLKGTSSIQADVMFLNLIQVAQGYGCVLYEVLNSIHKKHTLILSPAGATFVYDQKPESEYVSDGRELFAWIDVIDVTYDQFCVILHLTATNGTTERKLKLKGKHSEKKARRLAVDLERYRSVYCSEDCSEDGVNSPGYSAIPLRREKTMGAKLSSWKQSIKRIRSARERRNIVSP